VNESGQAATFDEFARTLASEFGLVEYALTEATMLADDLGFDSIQIFELVCIIEEFGGLVSDAALQNMRTLGDAYIAYVRVVTA
jgi:acyl carrier protein